MVMKPLTVADKINCSGFLFKALQTQQVFSHILSDQTSAQSKVGGSYAGNYVTSPNYMNQ